VQIVGYKTQINTNKHKPRIHIYFFRNIGIFSEREHLSVYLGSWNLVSSVGIATRYGVDGPGIESRWGGGGGVKFSAPVHTGPGAHSASYTKSIGFLSRGKSGRGVALTTHPHLAPKLMKE